MSKCVTTSERTSKPLQPAARDGRRAVLLDGHVVLEYDVADESPESLARRAAAVLIVKHAKSAKVIDAAGREFPQDVVAARMRTLNAATRIGGAS